MELRNHLSLANGIKLRSRGNYNVIIFSGRHRRNNVRRKIDDKTTRSH